MFKPVNTADEIRTTTIFFLMTIALLIILIIPEAVTPIRRFQKIVFLITAELLYFVILVPLVGGRSYCNLICPLGYAIKHIGTLRRWKK